MIIKIIEKIREADNATLFIVAGVLILASAYGFMALCALLTNN